MEAGIVLSGTEIKSIRAGKVNLADAFARIEKGEAVLFEPPALRRTVAALASRVLERYGTGRARGRPRRAPAR